jgi:superfamily II DNA or RNA helicase
LKERFIIETKSLVATGTGKTVISAFDYKKFRNINKSSKLLLLLIERNFATSKSYFQGVLKDNNFGDLWVDGIEPSSNEYLFVSVQTLNNRLKDLKLSPDYYDFIILDEAHHGSAFSYRPFLNYFQPKVLLLGTCNSKNGW